MILQKSNRNAALRNNALTMPAICRSSRRRLIGTTAAWLGLWAAVFNASAATLDVKAFGAKGDGATVDTVAIQKTIDECSRQGGGTVLIPAGQFVSGTVRLKDNVTLRLAAQAELLGSTNITDYIAPDKFVSGNGATMGHCFIAAVDARNVALEGPGVIDGRGQAVLAARPKGKNARPFLARFVRSQGISLRGVQLRNSAAWTVHFSQCKDVRAEGVKLVSRGVGNNDGFDIDSTQGVVIKNCSVDSGDDAIVLKTTSLVPTRDVEVTDCDLTSNHAGIKFGTESAANFENVKITRCHIHDTRGGGIKLLTVDGARLLNVSVSDVTMDKVNVPIFIRLGARLKTFRAGDTPQPIGTVSNVVIRNVRALATSTWGIGLSGIPGQTINDVTLEDIEIKLPGGGTREMAGVVLPEKESSYPEITMFGRQFPAYGLYARHVRGLQMKNIKFETATADLRPAIYCEDVQDLAFNDWTLPAPGDDAALVRFKSVRNARLAGFKPVLNDKAVKQEDCAGVSVK